MTVTSSDNSIVNMAWNGVLILALGFFVRLWIKNITDAVTKFCRENREDHKEIFDTSENHTERIAVVETEVTNLKGIVQARKVVREQ